tara:strand:- start:155 stop:1396 length:1242 start_codon:yes stop_codon:yes gene_type:complete
MENKYQIKNCTLIPTEGSSLSQEFDISAGNPSITYFESVKSPSISLTLSFIDVDGVISREGITGGEYLDLNIKVPDYDNFTITPDKHFMMLNSVKDVKTTSKSQIATLEFVSVESIINETARVSRRFTGNVSQIVKELLKDKKGIQTDKNLESDQSFNKYSFVGNLKRPFDTIQWLCPKAASDDKEGGFLFYETLDGYYFKSIKNLLEAEPKVYKKPETPIEPDGTPVNDFRIIENNLDSSNDIGMNCRMGMYANKTIFVDIETGTTKTVDFKISELGLSKPPKLPSKLEDIPTRLMLRILDKGALQKGAKKEDVEKENELAIYQNKSYARTNLLFSQTLSISIPFNPDLRAGEMIQVELPVSKGDKETQTTGRPDDNDISGKYLISELKHTIDGLTASTGTELKLIRDVFTA